MRELTMEEKKSPYQFLFSFDGDGMKVSSVNSD